MPPTASNVGELIGPASSNSPASVTASTSATVMIGVPLSGISVASPRPMTIVPGASNVQAGGEMIDPRRKHQVFIARSGSIE